MIFLKIFKGGAYLLKKKKVRGTGVTRELLKIRFLKGPYFFEG